MKKGKVTVVLDAQAGSCGKGKVVGYLALGGHNGKKYHVAINNFMSNAGHTFVADDGRQIMTQHLPTSMVNRNMVLCIGPGAAITPDILVDEIRKYDDLIGDRKIFIHERAAIILPRHAEAEKQIVRSGSTFKGCGVAQAEKIMRSPQAVIMRDYYHLLPADIKERIVVTDTSIIVNNAIDNGLNIMIEGSQGCDLDINYGLGYPHTTSRQCHAGQLVADCGISPMMVTDIIMIMRPYPIRISNQTNIGIEISSGDYAGSPEITWDIVKERCGAPDDIQLGEITTVTKKMRRVFEMNWDRLKYVADINRPTEIVLNFAQYLDWSMNEVSECQDLPVKVASFIKTIETVTGTPVTMIGTGAANYQMIKR